MSSLKQTVRHQIKQVVGQDNIDQARALCERSLLSTVYRLHPQSASSLRRLERYRDVYKGRRCFIIGNGPSLRQTDLSLLRDEVTFGLNRIYLMFDELGFTTSFLVSMNAHVIEQFRDDILALPMPKFLSWQSHHLIPNDRLDVTYLFPTREQAFSTDPVHRGIWEGATVTFAAMQLAYYMGFGEVVLVGVDHAFVTQGTPHKLVVADAGDPNHFSAAYFGPGVRWQLPDLETSEIAYRMARHQFEADGRSIIDATVGGKLTVFPKRDLHDLLPARSSDERKRSRQAG